MSKMTAGTLVLNRSWLAVQICTVKRAISLLYQGHARVVDEDFQAYNFTDWSQVSQEMVYVPEEFIHSPSVQIKIPRVIVLTLYDKLPKSKISFNRKNIFERDKYTCQYCGKKPPSRTDAVKWLDTNILNLDHVLPRSRGGKTTWTNTVVSCYKCNTKKGDSTLRELGWKLRAKPKAPEWRPTINIPTRVKPRKEWVNFLDLTYWNIPLENDMEDETESL